MNTDSNQSEVTQGQPKVSVIIPVFNAGPALDKCLTAIAASDYPVFERILVDDDSTDGMTAAAMKQYGVRVIKLDKNSGPGVARNRGASEASGDILFFIDSDVLLHPDAIAIAVRELEKDPGLSAIFGSYDDQPGHASFLSQYRNLFHHWVHQTGNNQASTFWAGCGAIRRKAFMEIGGFNSDYGRPSIEDIELGSRLRNSGHRIRLEKSMYGKHLKNWTFWNLIRTDIFYRGVPWMGLLLRQRHITRDLNLKLGSRIATALAALLAVSLLILPLTGNAAEIVPAMTFLLTAAAGIWLTGKGRLGDLISPVLVILTTLAACRFTTNWWAAVPLGLIAGLIVTQQAFLIYLVRKRGSAFAIGVIPMQVLFYLGCSLSVMIAVARHLSGGRMAQTGGVRG